MLIAGGIGGKIALALNSREAGPTYRLRLSLQIGKNVVPKVDAVLDRMGDFASRLRNGD